MNRREARKSGTVCAGLFLAALLLAGPLGQCLAQTPPTYPELFQNPPRSEMLTQDDLPNLSRLVVLEATSMFVHARDELSYSPEAYRLLNQIQGLWGAADSFTSAVAFSPTQIERVEAGRLSFPDLEQAYSQVQETLGRFPGMAPLSTENFLAMSRAVAVIGPLLQQTPPGADPDQSAAMRRALQDIQDLRRRARDLAPAIAAVRDRLKEPGMKLDESSPLDSELERLEGLAQGFARLISGQLGERDALAAFRPLRALAQRIEGEMSRGIVTSNVRVFWRAAQRSIDEIAERFMLPHEIVLGARAAASPEPDARLVEHLDEAIRQLETLLGQTEDSASRATQGAWSRSGARSLLTRLLVLRQQVRGGEPRSLLAQSLLEVDLARRQMDESAAGTVQSVDDSAEAATRRIDEAISQIREQLVNSR